jgi:NAD(P)-dependent dehydrogenase (short-subunit alcohol dehydrogenase family)
MIQLGTVIVIGGSSGIGFGVAEAALEAGACVIISSSNLKRLQDAAAILEKTYSGRIFYHQCDISDINTQEAHLTSLLEFSTSPRVNGGGKISHIVHTAGQAPAAPPIAAFEPCNALDMAAIRYVSVLTLAKLAPAYMIPGPKSSITYTSGTAVVKPFTGISGWIGIAAAVEATARALAIDLAPIRVNVVSPGAIVTPMMLKLVPEGDEEAKKRLLGSRSNLALLKKVGSTEEAAQPYLYFMRDNFQTGTVLNSDGGRALV